MAILCSICGDKAESADGIRLANGDVVPICKDCSAKLTQIKTNPPGSARDRLYQMLKEEADRDDVKAAIDRVYGGAAYALSGGNRLSEQNRLSGLVRSLNMVMVVLTVILMFGSVIAGIAIWQAFPATGWAVAIGGILAAALIYAVARLLLRTAEEIGDIGVSGRETSRCLAEQNRLLTELVRKMSEEKRD